MVTMAVTHGIFSKGLRPFKGLIDNIYCTDSIHSKYEQFKESVGEVLPEVEFVNIIL